MATLTMKASKGGGGEGFAKAPPGNHPAVCVAIIDLGTHESDFNGEVKDYHKLFFLWELVHEKNPNSGRNFVIGAELTKSLNEKAKLRQWIEARIGRVIPDGTEYPIESELGQPCLLNVAMKGDYPFIKGLSPMPKGMNVPAPSYAPLLWTLDMYSGAGSCNFPAHVPYLYGEPLSQVIARCQELRNGPMQTPRNTLAQDEAKPDSASQPATQQATQPTSAAPTSPPPTRRKPASSVKLWWVDPGTDGSEALETAMVESQIIALIKAKNLDPSQAFVKDAADEASDWIGMGTALPNTLKADAF